MTGARGQSLADYGWRFRGHPVGVLEDRSFTLDPARQREVAALMSRYCGDGASLLSCLQCGMCTASCNVVEDGNLFPRRQLTLLQLGQTERLMADPDVWLCLNCTDCSSRCPAKARPGRVMAAVRQMAIEHYAMPRFVGRLINSPRTFLWVVLTLALLLLAAIAAGGSFALPRNSVRYSAMLPHLPLDLVFLTATALLTLSAARGAARAWKAFAGEPFWRAEVRHLIPAVGSAVREILGHRQFSKCEQFPLSRWAHVAVLYGFLSLFVLSGLVAALTPLGLRYPFSLLHPLKIFGNLAATLLILGTGYFLVQRRRASASDDDQSTWFDWALLVELLLLGVTGVLTEVFRYINSPALAYPTYFAHLVLALTLLVSIPYSKFAHVIYRTLALTARQYRELGEVARIHRENRRILA